MYESQSSVGYIDMYEKKFVLHSKFIPSHDLQKCLNHQQRETKTYSKTHYCIPHVFYTFILYNTCVGHMKTFMSRYLYCLTHVLHIFGMFSYFPIRKYTWLK